MTDKAGSEKPLPPGVDLLWDLREQPRRGPKPSLSLDKIVNAVKPFQQAGFTDLAIVQVGDDGQSAFLEQAAKPLLHKLRSAAG